MIVLIPNSIIGKEGIEQDLDDFLCFLSEKFPKIDFFAGISKESDKIGQAKDSYNEALTALRMATMKK